MLDSTGENPAERRINVFESFDDFVHHKINCSPVPLSKAGGVKAQMGKVVP